MDHKTPTLVLIGRMGRKGEKQGVKSNRLQKLLTIFLNFCLTRPIHVNILTPVNQLAHAITLTRDCLLPQHLNQEIRWQRIFDGEENEGEAVAGTA